MKIIRHAVVFLITIAAVAAAYAQQNTFDIKTGGKITGSCHYSFDKTKDGFKISSHSLNHVPPQFQNADPTGKPATLTTEAQTSASYKLDANYNYNGGNASDTANQISIGFSLNKQRTQLQVTKMVGGAFSGDPIPPMAVGPGFVLLNSLDVSSIQGFLFLATEHPTADSHYFLAFPLGGVGIPQTTLGQWYTQADATGTLAGKPVKLHHFSFAFGKNIFDVYGDETNTLMEVDIATLHQSFVRTGFALDAAAPAAPAAN
jgi:hypothetical protein